MVAKSRLAEFRGLKRKKLSRCSGWDRRRGQMRGIELPGCLQFTHRRESRVVGGMKPGLPVPRGYGEESSLRDGEAWAGGGNRKKKTKKNFLNRGEKEVEEKVDRTSEPASKTDGRPKVRMPRGWSGRYRPRRFCEFSS